MAKVSLVGLTTFDMTIPLSITTSTVDGVVLVVVVLMYISFMVTIPIALVIVSSLAVLHMMLLVL
jgi:hypothetical protein